MSPIVNTVHFDQLNIMQDYAVSSRFAKVAIKELILSDVPDRTLLVKWVFHVFFSRSNTGKDGLSSPAIAVNAWSSDVSLNLSRAYIYSHRLSMASMQPV